MGRIPRDLFEDTLVPIFQKAGEIWDFRLMIDSLTGYNRGYAFCTYCTKDGAKTAVKEVSATLISASNSLWALAYVTVHTSIMN